MPDQLELIKRIKALSDTGLFYAENEYDKERYIELQEISFKLMNILSDTPVSTLKDLFLPVKEYPTPKIDVRGLVLNESNQILMVKEQQDGKWSIPGGWADIGFTASEVIVKEIEEETGLTSEVSRVLAVYDKKCHPHPPQPHYSYKIVFLCKITDGKLKTSFDIDDVAYFGIDNLPEISTDRILTSQIQQLYKMVIDNNQFTHFD